MGTKMGTPVSVSRRRIATVGAALLLAGLCGGAQAGEHVAVKRPFNLPPSAELQYTLRASQKGFTLDGSAVVKWRADDGGYRVSGESRASILGKILEDRSEGKIDAFGLAPSAWHEKRFRKDPTTTTFDREADRVSFAVGEKSYPLLGGEQDRVSAQWQLVSVARAAPDKMVAGSEWRFFVAGRRDAEQWTFKVVGREKLRTALGVLDTVHLIKSPPKDYPEQQLDLWLAPSREWYPVKLRLEEDNGDYVEQTIQAIKPG
jgi:hypothetical protein